MNNSGKRGEWIRDKRLDRPDPLDPCSYVYTDGYRCSRCNYFKESTSRFCPYCGADMRK